MPRPKSILWVDDEVESLTSHVLFLEEHGFSVDKSTHADDALALLVDPTAAERATLGAFSSSVNETVLHTDGRVLPRHPRARASWNYLLDHCASTADEVHVSYDMKLTFVTETVAYDVSSLVQSAHELRVAEEAAMLDSFLELDRPLRTQQQESALVGVRKAQVKLAAYYLARGQEALDCLNACYEDFGRRIDKARGASTCWCDTCLQLNLLDLKFVLHAGAFVIQDIAGQRELVGPQVVIAHRLLKSRAPELVGHNGYALVTDAAADALDIPDEGAVQLLETYDDATVSAHVFALR